MATWCGTKYLANIQTRKDNTRIFWKPVDQEIWQLRGPGQVCRRWEKAEASEPGGLPPVSSGNGPRFPPLSTAWCPAASPRRPSGTRVSFSSCPQRADGQGSICPHQISDSTASSKPPFLTRPHIFLSQDVFCGGRHYSIYHQGFPSNLVFQPIHGSCGPGVCVGRWHVWGVALVCGGGQPGARLPAGVTPGHVATCPRAARPLPGLTSRGSWRVRRYFPACRFIFLTSQNFTVLLPMFRGYVLF